MKGKYLNFAPDSKETAELREWWKALEDKPGDRAQLRRCKTITEVYFVPAYHKLRVSMIEHGAVFDDALAAVAAILSHVTNDAPSESFAAQMARPKIPGGSARVSGLRFRRLLPITNRDNLFRSIIRAVRLVDKTANVGDLAGSIYYWNDRVLKRWALDYYRTAPQEK